MKTKKLVLTAMLGAISGVLMLFEIPVFFVFSFIKLDFSELPIMIGGFLMGPAYGVAISVIKILVKLLFKFTTTGFVGEAANLFASLLYVLPGSLIYIKKKSKKRAVLGMTAGTLTTAVGMVLVNYFIMFPFYMKLYKMDLDFLIAESVKVNPLGDSLFKIMLFMILPFNILKYGLVSILTMFIYKRISVIFKGNLKGD